MGEPGPVEAAIHALTKCHERHDADRREWLGAGIIPDRKEVIEQMRRMGREPINEDELKNYTITYWIE